MVGDSSAAGLGVDRPDRDAGSADRRRPFRSPIAGQPPSRPLGAQTADLDAQIDLALDHLARSDVAVMLIGANDVTHRVRQSVSVCRLAGRPSPAHSGCEVVVGDLPRPWHGRADRAAVALPGPALVPATCGGPDDRGRGGRRPIGLVRRHPRGRVLGSAAVRCSVRTVSTRPRPGMPAPPWRSCRRLCGSRLLAGGRGRA